MTSKNTSARSPSALKELEQEVQRKLAAATAKAQVQTIWKTFVTEIGKTRMTALWTRDLMKKAATGQAKRKVSLDQAAKVSGPSAGGGFKPPKMRAS